MEETKERERERERSKKNLATWETFSQVFFPFFSLSLFSSPPFFAFSRARADNGENQKYYPISR